MIWILVCFAYVFGGAIAMGVSYRIFKQLFPDFADESNDWLKRPEDGAGCAICGSVVLWPIAITLLLSVWIFFAVAGQLPKKEEN